MFSTKTFVALLVFATPFLTRADVTPVAPAPGDLFNEGSTCTIAWTGDSSSTTLWKNMIIELMAGSNEDMQFITTVATGQDGTVTKSYSYLCPNVTPNSPIYFYQFTAPLAANVTWTGRFTIASSTGATTAATNSTTDADGTKIFWGNGALVDPSNVVAAPSSGASMVTSTSFGSGLAVATSSTAGSNTDSAASTAAVSSTDDNSSPVSSSTSTSSSAQPTSGAMTTTFDRRVLGVAAVATLVLSFVW